MVYQFTIKSSSQFERMYVLLIYGSDYSFHMVD